MFGQRENPDVAMQRENMQFEKDMAMWGTASREDPAYYEDRQQRENLTMWQQNLSDELTTLQYELINYQYDPNEGKWKPQKIVVGTKEVNGKFVNVTQRMPPMLNMQGVARVMTVVRRYLSRNVMNSNLDQPTIYRIMRGLGIALAILLAENHEYYELSMDEYHIVNKLIRDTVEFTLYRALGDKERIHQTTQRKMIEAYSERPKVDKPKMFGISLGGGK